VYVRKLALCLLLCSSTVVLSQTKSARETSPAVGDVYGGFRYVSSDAGFSGTSSGSNDGFNAGAEVAAYKWISFAGEFVLGTGKVTNASSKTYTAVFGPRLFLPIAKMPRFRPFADVMAGVTHVRIGTSPDSRPSTSSVTAMFGGGADLRVLRRLSWRAQMDYLRSSNITLINDEVQNVPNPPVWHLQISTGPVFHF
jgi:hypothetical protein